MTTDRFRLIVQGAYFISNKTLNLNDLKFQLQEHLQQTYKYLEGCKLQLLAHGEANVIYQMNQTSLVRVAVNTPNQRFAGDIRRLTQFEKVVLEYLQGTGIGHTLQRAMLQPNFPYSYLITNFLEGSSLNYSREHLQKCAQTLAQLHRLPLSPDYSIERLAAEVPVIDSPLTLFYNEARAYAQPYLNSLEAESEIVEMLQAVLAKAESRLWQEELLQQHPHICLVHSDHTCDNWVINNQQAYLIDWEWAELSSPAGDLGHFLSPVTVCRYQGYRMPPEDREFFLQRYYEALEDDSLIAKIQKHFAAFGVYPAVRSLCWTAGYWIKSGRWYEDAVEDSPSAALRLARWQQSRQQFPQLWQEVMTWLEEA